MIVEIHFDEQHGSTILAFLLFSPTISKAQGLGALSFSISRANFILGIRIATSGAGV